MAEHIKIRRAEGTWVIRAEGAVLGETSNALELSEGKLPPVIYFPRTDIAMAFFEPTDSKTTCQHKGNASYFTLHGQSEQVHDAAWSYEKPRAALGKIKDHLAFHSEKITVERLS